MCEWKSMEKSSNMQVIYYDSMNMILWYDIDEWYRTSTMKTRGTITLSSTWEEKIIKKTKLKGLKALGAEIEQRKHQEKMVREERRIWDDYKMLKWCVGFERKAWSTRETTSRKWIQISSSPSGKKYIILLY